MSDFISTNAIVLVALLGALLVTCALLLAGSMARRTREHDAIQRLLDLVDYEGRYACDEVMSRFVHDLKNLVLVVSMESERLETAAEDTPLGDQHAAVLRQVADEGRDLAERCREQMAPVELASSNVCDEIEAATRLLTDSGFRDVDVTIASAVPRNVSVARAAPHVHILVLAMVRAAAIERSGGPVALMVSTGRDAALAVDGDDTGWINISVACSASLAGDDGRVAGLARAARRLSGEVVLPDREVKRRRLAVSLPVKQGQGAT